MSNLPNRAAVSLCVLLLASCGGGGGGGGSPPSAPPPQNTQPTVNAGNDHSALERSVVQLAGTGTDAEGAVTYAWTQVSGPTVVFSNAAVANATFVAPFAPVGGTSSVELKLTVTDSAGATAADTVLITIQSNDYVVYSAGTIGPGEPQPGVYVYNAETGSIATVAPPTIDVNTASVEVAPDHSRVAFMRTDAGSATANAYTALPDGRSVNRINAPLVTGRGVSYFHWSPDSSRIAYLSDEDSALRFELELFTTLPDGSDRKKINTPLAASGTVFSWEWSPDGSRIAFTAQLVGDSLVQLYIAKPDGTGLVKLSDAQTGGVGSNWSFSPDGSRIAYGQYAGGSGANVVYTIRIDGTQRVPVFGPFTGIIDVHNWEWSPTSAHLIANIDTDAYRKYEAYAVRADGTQPAKISRTTSYAYNGYSAWQWTRDGARIAILTDANNDGMGDVESVSPDGTSRTTLSSTPGTAGGTYAFSWSPDGTRMVLMQYRTPGGPPDLFTVRADGTGKARLNDDLPAGGVVSGFPIWSPDSTRLAFSVEQITAGVSELYVVRADGTQRVHVTTKPEPPTSAQWAPDGSRLLYAKVDDTTVSSELFTVLPDGTDSRPLTTSSAVTTRPNDPVWSPDGSMVFYVQYDSMLRPELHVVRGDGTGNVQVNDTTAPNATVLPFGWAP